MPPPVQLRRDDDNVEKGGGGGGLWFLFFLLLLAAGGGGYYWWQVKRRDSSFQLHSLSSSTRPLRLSNDGPAAEEFISNNASTDSLPALAAGDVPYMPGAAAEANAAAHGLSQAPPEPLYRDDESATGMDPLGAGVPVSKSPSPNLSRRASSANDLHPDRSRRSRTPSPDPNRVFSLEDDSD